MAQTAEDAREKELAAYVLALTPEDTKQEIAFRTTQREAGRSGMSNLKDPNAPREPLSPYLAFLQQIRSDSKLVKGSFGDAAELAAAKWRAMTDDERKVRSTPLEPLPSRVSFWFAHRPFDSHF